MRHWIIKTERSESCYCVIPKAASSSIRITLGNSQIEETNTMPLEPILKWVVVRNPYSRLYSCWCSKVRSPLFNKPYELTKHIDEGATWVEFLKMVIETPDEDSNEHFAGQQFTLDSLGFFPDIDNCVILDVQEFLCRRCQASISTANFDDRQGLGLLR